MRGITARSIGLLCAALVGGCPGSRELGPDGEVSDAGLDAGPGELDAALDAGDASPPDAGLDGGPLASCDAPLASWTPQRVTYPGRWSAIGYARTAEGPRVVASPASAGRMMLFAFVADGATPELLSEVPLADTGSARPLAVAADAVRIATATDAPELLVHDVGGGLLSRAPLEPGGEPPVLVMGGVRIGMVQARTDGVSVEVRDVAGGDPLVSELLAGATDPAIGLGRGLFSFVVAEGATSVLHGLDELGSIRALDLGRLLARPYADEQTFVGVSDSIVLRFPAGRIEERELPASDPALAPTLAVGPHGAVVVAVIRAGIVLSIAGSEWALLTSDVPARAWADQGRARVGAFFLDDDALEWAGLSCAP